MTQGWGQGGPHEGFPAYQQPGYPQQPYQQFSGLPMAPAEPGQVRVPRPGVVMSAAVLAFVQAGLTAISTLGVVGIAVDLRDGAFPVVGGLAAAQLVGLLLLIFGGVMALQGKDRVALTVGNVLQLGLCLTYLILINAIPNVDPEDPEGARVAVTLFAVFFAVLPTISLVQTWVSSVGGWMGAQRGRY
ncbi:hypothetical protein [Alloactinosynnema sp. L-07]|uniref:hypothetical protein n=1 Tax=Alloactinosynnema sp. L-07 TaxID=1653480 RepID=UPI00065EF64F|nr:hypothetical protein [Alloactinosynnema sp. L-07]CRK57108.1 hypothetical protein [Alloactinosynnema sp. L-07]